MNVNIAFIISVSLIVIYFFIRWFLKKIKESDTPESHWNYRLATRISKNGLDRGWREFLIISAYYKKGKLESWGYSDRTSGFEDLSSLKYTVEKFNEATEKLVIDLDDFPNIWKP